MSAHKGQVIDGAFLRSLETLDLYIKSAMSGLLSGTRASHAYGSSLEWLDYKEYVPGDDLRRLDWNLVGRFDRYYTKYYADERQLHTHVYIDMSASMDADAAGQKGAAALRMAAAVGYLTVANMDRVSYRLLRGGSCESLSENLMGRDAFYGAAMQLSELSFGGDVDLNAAIRSDIRPGFDDGVSFLISDLLTHSGWKDAADYLLSRRRQVTLIHVLSPEELEPACSDFVELMDAEKDAGQGGLCLDLNPDSLEAYRAAVRHWLKDIRDFCAARDIAYLLARSDEKAEDVILRKGFEAGVIR